MDGNPRAHRRRAAAFAALGYAYIGAALTLLLALLIGGLVVFVREPGVELRLLIILGPVAWTIVESLAVHVDPPGGMPLSRHDAPDLSP